MCLCVRAILLIRFTSLYRIYCNLKSFIPILLLLCMINFNASFHLCVTSSHRSRVVCEIRWMGTRKQTLANISQQNGNTSSVACDCRFQSRKITIAYVDIHSLTVFSFELQFFLCVATAAHILCALIVIKYQSRTRMHVIYYYLHTKQRRRRKTETKTHIEFLWLSSTNFTNLAYS